MKWIALTALATIALLAACGGDDDDVAPTGVFTPVGTKVDTPTPPPDGDGGPAPDPVTPQLDEELTEIAASTFEATIEPGSTYTLDAVATTAADSGDASLTCETSPNFAFSFSWQVQDPFPPDGVQLTWQLQRDSGAVDIANTPSGEQTVGCEMLNAINASAMAITVAVSYRAGVIQ